MSKINVDGARLLQLTELLHQGAIELMKDNPRSDPERAADRSYRVYVRISQHLSSDLEKLRVAEGLK